uniref:NAC domain-containing protein n=1 Tax=Quercus lobata TaxID=97700 RepID=A0A7N2MH16_QUELO
MEKLSLDRMPPGVGFVPKDDVIIEHYLKKKITGNDKDIGFIPEIEFYKYEPWDLPNKSGIDSRDQEWFFFNTLIPKHQNGSKKNRTTKKGFWKTTGKDKEIKFRGSLIGMKKILVYRTPNEEGTKWVMHEYHTTQEEFDGEHPGQKAFVLCRLINKEAESNEGGSAKSDVTVPVQSNNYNYHNADVAKNQAAELTSTEIDFCVAEPLNVYNVSSPGDSPSSPNNIAVDKETLKNMASYTDNGSCGGSDANAQASENSQDVVDQDLDKSETFETGFIHPLGLYCNSLSPSTLTSVTPAVSSPTIAEASANDLNDYYWRQFMLNWPHPTAYEYWDLGHNNGSCGGSDANAEAYSYFINPYSIYY